MFQAEIVEGDHSNKDDRQRQDLLANVRVVLRLGKLRKETLLASGPGDRKALGLLDRFGDASGHPANQSRDDTLEPRDEEGSLDRNTFAGHQHLIQVDH